jgi:site-specific recombinase XerD
VWKSLTEQSTKQYGSHWERFIRFVGTYLEKHYSQVTKKEFPMYLAYLHNKKVKSTTIRSHVSAISFTYKTKGLTSPTDSFASSKLLAAYKKSDPPKCVRNPISAKILKKLVGFIPGLSNSKTEAKMLRSLVTLMYAALLRISEVTYTAKSKHNLMKNQVQLVRTKEATHVLISMHTCKFSKGNLAPMRVNANLEHPEICPVRAFYSYAKVRPSSQYAFCTDTASQLTPKYVRQRLVTLLQVAGQDAAAFNTHSFRIGRATDMYRQGYSDLQIAKAGRWNTKAFLKYIKPQIISLY